MYPCYQTHNIRPTYSTSRAVGNPCNSHLYAAGFTLSLTKILAAINSILTWANYIICRASHNILLSSSSPIPPQQMMDTQSPQPGPSRSKSSQLAGTSLSTLFIGTQQECRHQSVHRHAPNAATENMTQDAQLNIIWKTGSSTN